MTLKDLNHKQTKSPKIVIKDLINKLPDYITNMLFLILLIFRSFLCIHNKKYIPFVLQPKNRDFLQGPMMF